MTKIIVPIKITGCVVRVAIGLINMSMIVEYFKMLFQFGNKKHFLLVFLLSQGKDIRMEAAFVYRQKISFNNYGLVSKFVLCCVLS